MTAIEFLNTLIGLFLVCAGTGLVWTLFHVISFEPGNENSRIQIWNGLFLGLVGVTLAFACIVMRSGYPG